MALYTFKVVAVFHHYVAGELPLIENRIHTETKWGFTVQEHDVFKMARYIVRKRAWQVFPKADRIGIKMIADGSPEMLGCLRF